MSILYSEIYEKAIALFDDPRITQAYKKNDIQFDKLMYTFLQNSIGLFNNPARIGFLLANNTKPEGKMEIFESDGINSSYKLDENFEIRENSKFIFYINGTTTNGQLDKENKTVIFDAQLPTGQEYAFEQYYVGEFLDDFSSISSSEEARMSIVAQIKDILSRLLVKSWAESKRNFLLDIQNMMTDTDFSLSSNSPILNSKNSWINQLDSEVLQMQNKLAWQIRFAKGNQWG